MLVLLCWHGDLQLLVTIFSCSALSGIAGRGGTSAMVPACIIILILAVQGMDLRTPRCTDSDTFVVQAIGHSGSSKVRIRAAYAAALPAAHLSCWLTICLAAAAYAEAPILCESPTLPRGAFHIVIAAHEAKTPCFTQYYMAVHGLASSRLLALRRLE